MIEIPKAQEIETGKLKTDGQNPNLMTKKQIEALKKNITEFGFLVPIITNKEYVVADGEQRLTAAKELGMSRVPVIVLQISDVDRRILRQVLNKLKGQHEKEGDIAEFVKIMEAEQIEKMGELLAYGKAEMSQILDMLREVEEVPVPEVPKETKVKRGDIYQLGNHRLMCGDATNSQDIDNLLGNEIGLEPKIKADMVFTDPPYNVDYKSKGGHGYSEGKYKHKKAFDDDKSDEKYKDFIYNVVKIIVESTTNRG